MEDIILGVMGEALALAGLIMGIMTFGFLLIGFS